MKIKLKIMWITWKISNIRNKVTIMRKLQLQEIQSQLSYMKLYIWEIKLQLWDPKD